MKRLDHGALERSSVVANSRMNRERGVVGVNSYEKELRFNPVSFLADRLDASGSASWLDLCCGRGRALLETAKSLLGRAREGELTLLGVDLVAMFDAIPADVDFLRLESRSVHDWKPARRYDLITCVHGLHYVGDKLGLIERAAGWLSAQGVFVANLDLANLRFSDGEPLRRYLLKRLRESGLTYDGRTHLLSCLGERSFTLGLRYVGADDNAGPNYSGQDAVDSYYELRGTAQRR